jgi:hypothetical protein
MTATGRTTLLQCGCFSIPFLPNIVKTLVSCIGGLMCVRVEFVNRDAAGRSVSTGGRGGGGLFGRAWGLSVANALPLVDDPNGVYYTTDRNTGCRALVTSARENGMAYLRNTSDPVNANNLDKLDPGARQ